MATHSITAQIMDKRVNESLVARHEQIVLRWIAMRLPARCTPDRLTMLGICGAVVVLAGYALTYVSSWGFWLANAGLILHWFGDSLDGTVARLRRIERPRYGFYLDQVSDTVGNLLIGFGVGLCPLTSMPLALLILAVFHMLSIQVFVRTIVDREFTVAVGRFGPTELRLGIFGMNILLLEFGAPQLPIAFVQATWIDALMAVTIVGMLALLGWQMWGHLRRLAQEDPARPAAR